MNSLYYEGSFQVYYKHVPEFEILVVKLLLGGELRQRESSHLFIARRLQMRMGVGKKRREKSSTKVKNEWSRGTAGAVLC